MRLNPKLTWGLAWAGLAVVVAVPSADFLTGRLGGGPDAAAVLTSDIEPVKTAPVAPAEPLPVKTVTTIKTKDGISIIPAGSKPPPADPVEAMLSSGKPLPDYISDGEASAEAQTQVASIDPAPPTPFPSWARPKPAPAPAAPAQATPAATPGPVIVDETTLTGSIAEPRGPVPPAPIVDDSQNWDTETLRDYLERRGILEGGGDRSTARVTERPANYDPDGFYLSDGPNRDRLRRETRRERIQRLFEESDNDPDSFTLF